MTRTEFGKIQFVGKTKIFTVLSLVMILASLAFLFSKGLKYGIDFAGGTEAQIQFSSKVVKSTYSLQILMLTYFPTLLFH